MIGRYNVRCRSTLRSSGPGTNEGGAGSLGRVSRHDFAKRAELGVDTAALTEAAAGHRLDAHDTARLFEVASQIFKSGSAEGNYANYRAHDGVHVIFERKVTGSGSNMGVLRKLGG